ncbi:hypothetical protein QMZ30_18165 [Pantoea sp. EA-12]|nr:hypothetical protein [Pantoea sp. EA-12]MDI9222836.1 hypothetical protein [Pantoea sp. EA-12]
MSILMVMKQDNDCTIKAQRQSDILQINRSEIMANGGTIIIFTPGY